MRYLLLLSLLALAFQIPEGIPGDYPSENVHEILSEYCEDFGGDPFARQPVTFGVELRDAEPSRWHVVVHPAEPGDQEVYCELIEGFPEEPCFYFTLDRETLGRLHSGELAALTAMGKAFASDVTPMDISSTEGFAPPADFQDHVLRLAFHFWTRGFPELVRFGELENTRKTHGAQATLFYYQPGIRLGYFTLLPGQHANEDPRSRSNPFPTFFIATKGQAEAILDGERHLLSEGQAIFIGPGVSHEFVNPFDSPAQGVLVMFGDGA